MKNFIRNSDGFVLPLVAIVLMFSFLVGGIIIDAGNLYLRHGELQYLAKQAANTGIISFVQTLQNVADTNKNAICYVEEEPPEICISNNIFDFLSAEEVLASVSSPSIQQQVVGASKNFIQIYDPQESITDEDIQVIFPDEFSDSGVQIRVRITTIPVRFFSGLFSFSSGEIRVEAVSFMGISI